MRLPKLVFAFFGAAALISAPTLSQTSAVPKDSFEIVSIKPSAPDMRTQINVEPGGRFVANGVPLGLLVAIAYHLQSYQMVGVDGWLLSDKWTIEAKTAEGTVDAPSTNPPYMGVPDSMAVRLRSVLTDRFALKTHWETRERQVYELTLGPDGSKLKSVNAPPQASPNGPPQTGARPPLTSEGKPPAEFAPPPGAAVAGPGIIAASAISMDQIVQLLGRMVDYPVVDKTGLTGYFNVRLQFDPQSAPRSMGAPAPPTADPNPAAVPSDDPPIFQALQQQLGLKLQTAKEPVEVLVIDSATRPTAN